MRSLPSLTAIFFAAALALTVSSSARAANPPTATSVSAGGAHTCAIRADGRLACWGDDSSGQVSDTPSGEFAAVSAGGAHSCAIGADGRLACWGDDSSGQVSGAPEGEFISVSAGGAHSCAIRTNHELVCWGDDSAGQVSGGPDAFHKHNNDKHHHHGKDDPPDFLSVSAGEAHTCGIAVDHEVVCWGDDSSGQVSRAPGGDFLSVSAGASHNCGLRTDGQVRCWGDDSSGKVSGGPAGEFVSVAAGGSHSCAIDADGHATCWGDDSAGQVEPRMVSAAPPRAVVGVPYLHRFETTPQKPEPELSVSNGQLPDGLGLDTAGEISGEATSAGHYTFTVVAANGITEDATQEATLEVVGAPLLAIGSASQITTTSARLSGSINPSNLPAEAWFEFWPAGEPAAVVQSAAQSVSSGVAPVSLSAQIGGLSAATEYAFRLAATNELGPDPVLSETASFTTASIPPPPAVLGLPPPIAGQTVNVEPVDGVVATKCGEGGDFTALRDATQIPVGCLIDTRNGTVALTASKGTSGETETGAFWAGLFRVTQRAGDNQDAVFTLAGRRKCEKRRPDMTSRATASGKRGRGRKLWGSGKGNFKTVGSYGSASVRGTTWLVVDRCDNSTLFKVGEGTVFVRDFVKGGSVVLNTGQQYLAKAPIPRLR